MRWNGLAFLLITVLAGLSLAQKTPKSREPVPPKPKDLIVHEWGVFRVHEDVEMANADCKAEWASMPKFIYGQIAGRELPQSQQALDIILSDKPVVFFHAAKPLDLTFRVDFPGGMPAVWWPGTSCPRGNDKNITPGFKDGEAFRHLEWSVHLKELPVGMRRPNGFWPDYKSPPEVPKGHWFEDLRMVKADILFAVADIKDDGTAFGISSTPHYDSESFLYYDGLVPGVPGVHLTFARDKVAVTNRAAYKVEDVTVVDRRTPGHIKIALLAKLEAKARTKPLEFVEVKEKDWPAESMGKLVTQLKEAGLFEDEAKSLAIVWNHEFFQTEGVSVFYRLPQEEYDRLLPVKIRPRADEMIRVGLVHQPHCEPDLAERLAALVQQLNDNDFQTRETAHRRLEDMGQMMVGYLLRLRAQPQSPEVKRRLDQILEKYDTHVGKPQP